MAKGIRRKGKAFEVVSAPLEEYFEVPFRVVGRRDWLEGSFEPGILTPENTVAVCTSGDLADVKAQLDRWPHHGVDTETSGESKRDGLDPLNPRSRVVLQQIGTPELVYAIQPELASEFKHHLESPDFLHILQNGIFDFKFFLHKYGIHMDRIYDTMIAEQLLTSGLAGVRVGLEDIARKYPPHRIISKETRKKFINFQGRFSLDMLYYAVRDVVLLFPAMAAQIPLIKRWKMEVVAKDEFDCIPCTAMMELGGVPLDEKTMRLALSYWENRERELEQQILDLYDQGMDTKGNKVLYLLPDMKMVFDVGSNAQKLAALKNLGFEIDDVKRDTLEALGDHEIARALAEYSAVTKITSTYGENMLQRINPLTHGFHPEFNQLGAGDLEERRGRAGKGTIATGRYSSDFQQIPQAKLQFALASPQEEQAVRMHPGLGERLEDLEQQMLQEAVPV